MNMNNQERTKSTNYDTITTDANTNKKAVKLFLLLVLVLSAMAEGFVIITGTEEAIVLLMAIPTIAALIAKQVYLKGEKKVFSIRKCQWKYIGLALLFPLIYMGIPYLIYWVINPGSMIMEITPMQIFATTLGTVLGIVANMLPSLGEEIGWRGFLVPRLMKRVGLEKMLILTGLIWGVWHCPLLISGLYMPGTPVWFKVPMFIIIIGSVGVVIAIITLRAKSIWPAVVMHAAHNMYDQAIFSVITEGENKMYYVSETGIFTAVIAVGMAIWMYRSYKKQISVTETEQAI